MRRITVLRVMPPKIDTPIGGVATSPSRTTKMFAADVSLT